MNPPLIWTPPQGLVKEDATYIIHEDYLQILHVTANSILHADTNWQTAASSGTLASQMLSGHPGVLTFNSGSTAGNNIAVFKSSLIYLGTGDFQIEGFLRVPVLPDASQKFTIFIGIGSNLIMDLLGTTQHWIGFALAYDLDETKWTTVAYWTTTKRTIATPIVCVANQFYRLRVKIKKGKKVSWYIDNVLVDSLDLPSVYVKEDQPEYLGASIRKTLGSGGRSFQIDWTKIKVSLLRANT